MEKEHSFFLRNLKKICILNDSVYAQIKKHSLDNTVRQNTMTWEDVCVLAREIIEKIDGDYIADFDRIIVNGELGFVFGDNNKSSSCSQIYGKGEVIRQLIDLDRTFNYDDVVSLIHEFIHYTNGKKHSKNRNVMTEFLSIYFEFYALDYLLAKGIDSEEIDVMFRFKAFLNSSLMLMGYEIVLLTFEQSGPLTTSTIDWVNRHICDIEKDAFEKECIMLYENLCLAKKRNEEAIVANPQKLGEKLSREFIALNYRYVLGTILAIYTRKYAKFKDVVELNNNITVYDDKSISEICLKMGIDLYDRDFQNKLFVAIDEYMEELRKYIVHDKKQ